MLLERLSIPAVIGVGLVAAGIALAGAAPRGSVEQQVVREALHEADALLDDLVDEWIHVAEIPAPSGAEQERAAYIEERFARLGVRDVHRDQAGNVVGFVSGRSPSVKSVAVLAHLDTVAPAGADYSVHRLAGGRLQGPGVRDNSSGVVGMLAVLELIQRHGLKPEAGTFFVATVREEIGLEGAQRFIADHEGRLGAVIAVDGYLGQISHGATGIVWLKLHFRTKGAHTLRSRDEPSAVLAAARAIERISALPMRRSPDEMETWINIGMIGGGDVPNAQARDAWFTVDLRSNDPDSLTRLEDRVLTIGEQTAHAIGVRFDHETMHRMNGGRILGSESSTLVMMARRSLRAAGWESVDVTLRGTADHNVAIRHGIPGIAIGMTTGGGAHTPTEYADTAPLTTGIKQLLLLVLSPLTR